MKLGFILLFLCSCTMSRNVSTSRIVTLDCRPSYILGGRGNGYFTAYEWREVNGKGKIKNANSSVAEAYVEVGIHEWQVKITDNLGNTDSAVLRFEVK